MPLGDWQLALGQMVAARAAGRDATVTDLLAGLDLDDAELRGMKLRGGARGTGIRALERVLIVLIVVAGAVAIVRGLVTSPEARRPDVGRCIERLHVESLERNMCAGDGS